MQYFHHTNTLFDYYLNACVKHKAQDNAFFLNIGPHPTAYTLGIAFSRLEEFKFGLILHFASVGFRHSSEDGAKAANISESYKEIIKNT